MTRAVTRILAVLLASTARSDDEIEQQMQRQLEESSSCPITYANYVGHGCTTPIVGSLANVIFDIDTTSSSECYFLDQTEFYKYTGCENISQVNEDGVMEEVSVVHFTPCNPTEYLSDQTWPMNTCIADYIGSYSSYFAGVCGEGSNLTCPTVPNVEDFSEYDDLSNTSVPSPTNIQIPSGNVLETPAPTASPTVNYIVDLVLPTNLPLKPNSFADEILDPTYAFELTFLSCRVYGVDSVDSTVVADGFNDKYEIHLFEDILSDEIMVVSSNHTYDSDGSISEEGRIAIAIRGTTASSPVDWVVNLNGIQTDFGPLERKIRATVEVEDVFNRLVTHELKVHQGFNTIFDNGLYDRVVDAVERLLLRENKDGGLYYSNNVHFTGHSQGAAKAHLFGAYYAQVYPQRSIHLVSVASPRVGNYAFKIFSESLENLRIWRIVNCRDLVPRLPNFQYYHAGHLIWRRCDRPTSINLNVYPDLRNKEQSIVQGYYRENGDTIQNYEKLDLQFVVHGNEPNLLSDHACNGYMEWLAYARNFGDNYWISSFEEKVTR